MNIKELQKHSTAAELCLIDAVTRAMHKEVLNKVLGTFSSNLEKHFHPSMRWEGEELKRTLQSTLAATQKDLGLNE